MSQLEAIVSGERVHRPLMHSRLTTEDSEKARLELNETPEVRERLLHRFKEMLTNELDFSPQTDDNYLLRFLRTRKFDLERSYKLMRNYYKFRAAHPDLYPLSPFDISDTLRKTNIFDYPPYRDHMGRAIYHVKLGNWDPDVIPYKDFMAAGIMISEFVQENPVTQINGVVGLWDFKGFGLKHFIKLSSPRALWNLRALIQECQPGRYKGACIVNCHPLAAKCWNLLSTFLKEKFRKRMRLLLPGDLEGLHDLFDPCILPPEYGGRMKWDNQDIVKSLFEKEQYMKYTRSFGYKT